MQLKVDHSASDSPELGEYGHVPAAYRPAAAHPRQDDRVAALRSYQILDTPREAEFDNVTDFLARICDAPIAALNLIDADRQFFKSEVGLGAVSSPLETSLCAHAILEDGLVEVPDTRRDPRFQANPQCTGDEAIRFYAGAPLMAEDGLPIGSLCVIDTKPRTLTPLQRDALLMLAAQVMAQLNLRRTLARQRTLAAEADHRIKNSLQTLEAMVRFQRRTAFEPETQVAMRTVENRLAAMARLHALLQDGAASGSVDLGDYLVRVIEQLSDQAPRGVEVEARMAPLHIAPSKAASLGIIVSEWVANAFKHAFPEGRGGHVEISLLDTGAGTAQLQVADDGVGTGAPQQAPGLGSQIIQAAMENVDGTAMADADTSGLRQRLIFTL